MLKCLNCNFALFTSENRKFGIKQFESKSFQCYKLQYHLISVTSFLSQSSANFRTHYVSVLGPRNFCHLAKNRKSRKKRRWRKIYHACCN